METKSQPPVHVLSALIVIALDSVWGGIEAGATASVVGLPLVPVLCLVTGGLTLIIVTMVQHFVSHDPWGAAWAKGMALGVLAGVPYMFAGTSAGVILLAWAGISQIFPRLPGK